jgi:hypothetical protein
MTSISESDTQKIIDTINKQIDPDPYSDKHESTGITAEQLYWASEYLYNEQISLSVSAAALLIAASSMLEKGEMDTGIYEEIEAYLHKPLLEYEG